MKALTLAALLLFAQPQSQSANGGWHHDATEDAILAKKGDRFTLVGKYVKSPSVETSVPSLVVNCIDGKANGTFVYVGAVVTEFPVSARLDDKVHVLSIGSISTNGQAIFFERGTFNKILNSKHIVLAASEYLGGSVVMEFENADASQIFAACSKDRFIKPKK